MPGLRFLQFSDLHLDGNLAGSRLRLPPEKREILRRDGLAALAAAMQLTVDREVDVVLCPGDLWDDESVGLATATNLYDAFARVAPVPVLVAPGNHDPGHGASFHDARYYQRRVGRPHPSNVHVFPTGGITQLRVPGLDDVVFCGHSFEGNVPRTQRLMAEAAAPAGDSLAILLWHGSRDDVIAPGDANRPATAPFSAAELLAAGFDYAALGHYHAHSTIVDASGRVRGAYAGCTIARGLDETAPHGVLLGEVDHGGIVPGTLELVPVGTHRVMRVAVVLDRSVTHADALRERVEPALAAAGCTAADIVYVELTGRTHPEVPCPALDSAWAASVAFHLELDMRQLQPDYDLAALPADRLEGAFARRMTELIAAAADEDERARLRYALYLGLDALHNRQVQPRHAY